MEQKLLDNIAEMEQEMRMRARRQKTMPATPTVKKTSKKELDRRKSHFVPTIVERHELVE